MGEEKMRSAEIFKSAHFSVRVSENTKSYNRLGVIIANSAVKKSTRRHFWKRQFTESIRRWPDTGRDILIIATPKLDSADKKTIQKEIADIFGKLK